MTSGEAKNDLPWLVSFYYWFQSMTTIGQIPFHVKTYEGWNILLLVPYNIIFFGGLVTIVAMLSLSLDSIMQCKGLQCCCMKEDDEEEREEEEEEKDTSCACLLESEDDDLDEDKVEDTESKKPLLKK